MKHMIGVVMAAVVLGGCSGSQVHVESMLDHPPKILEDSLYEETQSHLDAVERRYLNREISYAEYLRQKAEWEEYYQQQTEHRAGIVDGNLQEGR